MPICIWSEYFFSVAEELFADGNMNWGRVITDYVLAKVFTARISMTGPPMVHEKDLLTDLLSSF